MKRSALFLGSLFIITVALLLILVAATQDRAIRPLTEKDTQQHCVLSEDGFIKCSKVGEE